MSEEKTEYEVNEEVESVEEISSDSEYFDNLEDDEMVSVTAGELRDLLTEVEELHVKINSMEKDTLDDVGDRLFEGRYIYINDFIDEQLVENIVPLIHYYNMTDEKNGIEKEDREEIKLFINTDGGCVYSSILIAQELMNSVTPVKAICNGKAYSGGFLIFMAIKNREMGMYADLMFHEVRTGERGIAGTHKEINRSSINLGRLQKIYDEIVIKGSNITQKQLNRHKEKVSDWFIDRNEAIKLGIIKE